MKKKRGVETLEAKDREIHKLSKEVHKLKKQLEKKDNEIEKLNKLLDSIPIIHTERIIKPEIEVEDGDKGEEAAKAIISSRT